MERETLVDFLKEQAGYYVKDECLMRPDKSVAAVYKGNKWETRATPEEMVSYNHYCGRCYPSKLPSRDLTNPGSK